MLKTFSGIELSRQNGFADNNGFFISESSSPIDNFKDLTISLIYQNLIKKDKNDKFLFTEFWSFSNFFLRFFLL